MYKHSRTNDQTHQSGIMESILVLLLTLGFSSGVLLQDDVKDNSTRLQAHPTNDQRISELTAQFAEEKNHRVHLEDRLHTVETKLRQLDQHNNDVSKDLQNEIATRQQLEAKNADVKMDLDNVTSKLAIVSQDYKKCGANLVYNTNKLNNVTEEVKNLQHDGSDIEQRIAGIARELSTVKSQYTILLNKHANSGHHAGLVPTRPTTAGM